MKGKHGGYELVAYDTVFYRGYCCDRDVENRRKEHIATAKSPSLAERENRIIRGGPSQKDKFILAAIEDGEEIIIRRVVVKELYEVFDEEEFIQEGRQLGYPMTNKAVGGLFQPYALVNGELVPTVKVNGPELREAIQDSKKRPRAKRAAPEVKWQDPKPMSRTEFESTRDTAWSISGVVTKWKGDYKAFCDSFEKGWKRIELIP